MNQDKEIDIKIKVNKSDLHVMFVIEFYPRSFKDIAKSTKWHYMGDKDEQSLKSYTDAVNRCIKNRWIMKVSSRELLRQKALAKRFKRKFPDRDEFIIARKGEYDLTARGYEYWRIAYRKITESGPYSIITNSRKNELEIYASTREDCLKTCRDLADINKYVFFKSKKTITLHVKSCTYPVNVDKWWFNRFEIVSNGFLIRMKFGKIIKE